MKPRYRPYTPDDMMKVSRFLSHAYSKLKRPNSWLIGRWEFEIFFFQKRAGVLPQWERNIGLWEYENGELAAIACKDGDFYFQLDTEDPEEDLLMEMFEFIESLSNPREGVPCKLDIPITLPKLEDMARNRGYELLNERDNAASITLDRYFPVEIPQGIFLRCGEEVSDKAKALGHIMAFNYPGTLRAQEVLKYYGGIREAPHYRPDLDLSLVNEQGEVVSFCNVFIDELNRIGIFEPVGTHIDYRRRGLGRAVIYESLNRLQTMGIVKAYTGPMQPFYERIGFEIEVDMKVWSKA